MCRALKERSRILKSSENGLREDGRDVQNGKSSQKTGFWTDSTKLTLLNICLSLFYIHFFSEIFKIIGSLLLFVKIFLYKFASKMSLREQKLITANLRH